MYTAKKPDSGAIWLTRTLIPALLLILTPLVVESSANQPKPGQTSTTCYYNFGPKLGQTESLAGSIKPVLIGKACIDGAGSSGLAVLDKEDHDAEEAEEAAEAALLAEKNQQQNNLPLSTLCQFNQGPKAGQVENFQGKLKPIAVGTPCTDGLRSIGVTITE